MPLPDSPMIAVCYVSSAVEPLSDAAIDALLLASRARNQSNQVTGMLLYCDGNFMQYIEGPSQGLEPIWKSIQRDPRHRGMTTLFEEPVPQRVFRGWSMAYKATQPPELAGLLQSVENLPAPAEGADRPQLIGSLLQSFWQLCWSRG